MNKVGKFEKVSIVQYSRDTGLLEDNLYTIYRDIKLPLRATVGSCGYDFFSPLDIELKAGETVVVHTGIRCRIQEGWFLMICPRSGLGFKYRVQLDNTVGIIDQDYYGASNEGHIILKITNDGKEGKTAKILANNGFAQGIFLPFGITEDDCVTDKRDGGFGSTSR